MERLSTMPINKQNIIRNNKNGVKCVTTPGTARGCSTGPILSCKHRSVESCHTTHTTVFTPAMYEKCEDVYEKTCYIHTVPRVVTQTVVTCHTPHTAACNTSAHTHCQTSYQTVCTRTYNQTAGVVCERHSIRLCGTDCIISQEEEDICEEKDVATIVEVPEENCDLGSSSKKN